MSPTCSVGLTHPHHVHAEWQPYGGPSVSESDNDCGECIKEWFDRHGLGVPLLLATSRLVPTIAVRFSGSTREVRTREPDTRPRVDLRLQ